MTVKAVIFDMDGVIFDSEKLVLDSWRKVALKYGIPNVEVPYEKCLGVNAIQSKSNFLEYYGGDFPYDEYKKEVSELYHSVVDAGGLALKPYVVEFLQYLKGENYRIGLASSTRVEVVKKQLIQAGIMEYFDDIVGGDMVSNSKPHPQIYLTACARLGAEPCNAWAVEDSYNGVMAGKAAGMQVLMVPDMKAPNDEIMEYVDMLEVNLGQAMKQFRLKQQMDFILEVDKLKNIGRQTYLSNGLEKEDDAQHSWHLALMAYILAEHSNEPVDVARVMAMTLAHDLVEIDAGDTYAYDEKANESKRAREEAAADRIYGLLPKEQAEHMRQLWEEFEEKETPESKFANTLDKVQPLMLNDASGGRSWKEHGVRMEQVMARNAKTAEGSEKMWEFARRLIEKNVEKFS